MGSLADMQGSFADLWSSFADVWGSFADMSLFVGYIEALLRRCRALLRTHLNEPGPSCHARNRIRLIGSWGSWATCLCLSRIYICGLVSECVAVCCSVLQCVAHCVAVCVAALSHLNMHARASQERLQLLERPGAGPLYYTHRAFYNTTIQKGPSASVSRSFREITSRLKGKGKDEGEWWRYGQSGVSMNRIAQICFSKIKGEFLPVSNFGSQTVNHFA